MPPSGDQSTADKPVTDIGVQRLARVYAQAILDAAGNAGCRNEVLDELRALATEVLPKVPAAAKVFASPRVSVEEKGAMIDKICAGRVLPTTLHSLHVLARHDRLGLLANVVAAAGQLADERDGLQRAEFTTAVPLDAAEREQVAADTAKALGLRLAPTFTVNPDVLGGLVVRVEDTVYDHSVATSLRRLGSSLKQRSIHEIQYRRDRLGTP
jgi:F-type H+-transporting ATPase subunit delta